ncbi:MAG TPA: AMP-binding protein [Acidimicrobiales bacterium]
MRTLLALDLALGPDLENAIRDCVDSGDAFCVLDQRLARRRRDEELEWLGATEVLDVSGRRTRREGQLVDDEIGLVMLTSGSSGQPKAAELSWGALRASADLTQSTLRGATAPIWFPTLPANHIGGLAVLLRAILSDAWLLWGDAEEIEQAPSRGATHVSIVRTQLARFDVSSFHRVLLGGARPPGELPDNVITTWGMTETGSGVVYDGVALPGVDVAEIDGELCVRTPTLFRSYRNTERPCVTGPDGLDDWFPTGDGGDVIEGRVRVRGRLGFVINTGGEKLWPEDLEAVLTSLDGIVDVAVTGVDDPEWGQRVVALVVSDGSPLNDAIREEASDRIGPWAKPKEIRYVTAIPRTSNGKIRRDALENLY